VAVVDQRLPDAYEDVSTILPPVQIVVPPDDVITGAAGLETVVTVTGVEGADTQPLPSVNVTENVPAAQAVTEVAKDPFDQVFPLVAEEVRLTLPPGHNAVEPLAVTVGAAGIGLVITSICVDSGEVHPPRLV
jgi:hypothetical protein